MKAGNLLLHICHMLSGNNYVKTALFANFLKLGFVGDGEANYYRTSYLLPLAHNICFFTYFYYYFSFIYYVIIIALLLL